jgi:hypothetical protein
MTEFDPLSTLLNQERTLKPMGVAVQIAARAPQHSSADKKRAVALVRPAFEFDQRIAW